MCASTLEVYISLRGARSRGGMAREPLHGPKQTQQTQRRVRERVGVAMHESEVSSKEDALRIRNEIKCRLEKGQTALK